MIGEVQGPFLMTGRAEAPAFAEKGDKHLVVTFPTAHPGKSIINNAAPAELLHHFINYRTPGAKITAITARINPFEFVKVFDHELIE